MADIASLFHEHGAGAFEKQLRLMELLGDRAWQFGMGSGKAEP